MIIAGCQIHHAVKSDERPDTTPVQEMIYGDGNSQKINRPTEIYIAQ